MSFVNLSRPPLEHRAHSAPHVRPRFNSQNTSDRLREGSGLRPPPFGMVSNIKKDRKSVFKELGLDNEFSDDDLPTSPTSQHALGSKESMVSVKEFEADASVLAPERERGSNDDADTNGDEDPDGRRSETGQRELASRPQRQGSMQVGKQQSWYSKLATYRRPRIQTASSAPPPTVSSLQRLGMIAMLIAVIIPAFSYNNGGQKMQGGADAGVVRYRQTTPVDVCLRWSQQVALLNGTLYVYGGQARTDASQTTDTWNNNFLTLDLTKSWDGSSPSFKGNDRPDGPPAVANGYLWNDYNYLYLYGGQFADNAGGEGQYAAPEPMSIWRYSIKDDSWLEFSDPKTSAGNYSTDSNIAVQRSSEGAGLSVPELGLSWYFGGHLDQSTTQGWSIHTPRVYLKSLLEFTHPGFMNTGVNSLRGAGAADGGVFRNITEGGLQDTAAFPERADGVLVFVPGWGPRGVLIGMAGGSADTFVDDLGTLDVYDIATSEWYHQKTTGDKPSVRVNPCAVIASAPDASSFQIYFFGGQNLQPYKEQTQYNDMYILTIPSFTWIQVDEGSGVPTPRAGHTCSMRDGQMIVVGGYIGQSETCDKQPVYVFDASNLEWKIKFEAADHPADLSPDNSVLAGSYGYKVPGKVQSVIGGNSDGGATATTPAAGPATGGPFATGKPPVFTITQDGSTATVTAFGPTSTGVGGAPAKGEDSGTNPGLIAAGIVAGLFGALALYLGFCAWLYRRQVAAYKQHLSQVNRYSGASSMHFAGAGGLLGVGRAEKRSHRRDNSTVSDESFSWVGAGVEPKWMMDESTPESGSGSGGTGTATGSGSVPPRMSEDLRSGRDPRTSSSRHANTDNESVTSADGLLEGQEPSFFSVVMGPRRALRVVNGAESP